MSAMHEWLAADDFNSAVFLSVFVEQMDQLTLAGLINPFPILDEIRLLEGIPTRPTNTKRASAFRGGLLDGLMHKHYFNARHIQRNLLNYHSKGGGAAFERAISNILRETKSDQTPWQIAGRIADRSVNQALHHKNLEGSLTGDWIVYAVHGGKNYYLCLASHDESNETIFDRFSAQAAVEFPELGIQPRLS